MKTQKRNNLIALSSFIFIIVIASFYLIPKIKYTSKIPTLPDTSVISEPVREQIKAAIQKARLSQNAANLGHLGMVYHSSANYEQAGKCYELAIQKEPDNWIWSYYNGYLKMEMGESEKAVSNFKTVVALKPENVLACYYLGKEFRNLKDNESSISYFQKASAGSFSQLRLKSIARQDHFPISSYASFELARIWFDTGQTEKAKTELMNLIKNDNLFGASYKLAGNIYNLEGQTVLGKKYTIRANDLVDFSPPVDSLMDQLVLLSRSELFLLKKIDEAENGVYSDWALQLVNHGLKYLPDNEYLLSKAIKINLWKKQNDIAIGFIDKHIELIHDNFNEIKNTGMYFYMKNLFPQAARYWQRALELKPGEILITQYLAKCLWSTGNKQKAMDLLDALASSNPENVSLIAEITDLNFQFGNKDKRIFYLEKLRKLAPDHPKTLRFTGVVALIQDETSQATILFNKSLKADPKDSKTIENLGSIFYRQKNWRAYIDLYRFALENNPNYPEYLARLGEILINCTDQKLQNIVEGTEFLERAFTHYNCPADILIAAGSNLSYAYSLQGQKQKALSTIGKTINIGRTEKIPANSQEKLERFYQLIKNSN